MSINGIHHFGSGKIQNILISSMGNMTSRSRQNPVRMLSIEIAVLVDHFRLKPETEFHAFRRYLLRDSCNAIRQLFQIRIPVSQRRMIILPFSEPSVIQYKQFDSKLFCRAHDLQNLFLIEIKISRFPVIDENRSRSVSPVSSCQACTIQTVECLTHPVQSAIGIDHHRLRCLKLISVFHFPGKPVRMNSQRHSCDIVCIHLCLRQKIPAVNKTEAIHFPARFRGILPTQCQKRIKVTAAASAHTINSLNSILQLSLSHRTLSSPGSRQLDHLIVVIRQIHTAAHCTFQHDLLCSVVNHLCTSCNRRKLFKNRIVQDQCGVNQLIFQFDFQCLCLFGIFGIGSRQSCKRGLPVINPMCLIHKIRDTASILLQNLHRRIPHIPCSIGRIFLLDMFHRECGISFVSTYSHWAVTQLQQMGKTLPVMQFFPKIQLS